MTGISLIRPGQCSLFIFNMQVEMISLLRDGAALLRDCCWLAEVANSLDVPVTVFEHRGLGAGAESLRAVTEQATRLEKATFDSLEEPAIRAAEPGAQHPQVVLAGSETHVTILPTALSFQALGKEVFVIADAVSTRYAPDHEYGLGLLRAAGIILITKEIFFFQLLRSSEDPRYLPLARRFLDGRYFK